MAIPPSIGVPGGFGGPLHGGAEPSGHGGCAIASLVTRKNETNSINEMYFLNIKLSPFTK